VNENGATGLSRRATAALLLAVLAAAVGWSSAASLPIVLETFLPSAPLSSIGWHT
jgi:hypothetical protein